MNDDCCRENLGLIADTSISGDRVTRELDALVRLYGKPERIVSDNGTEFTSKAVLKWAKDNAVEWHHIDPFVGKTIPRTVILSSEPAAERLHRKLQRQPARRMPQ